MLNKEEKVLLVQLIANVDDLVEIMTEEQKKKSDRNINKIQGNFRNLMDGVGKDG